MRQQTRSRGIRTNLFHDAIPYDDCCVLRPFFRLAESSLWRAKELAGPPRISSSSWWRWMLRRGHAFGAHGAERGYRRCSEQGVDRNKPLDAVCFAAAADD